MTYHARVAENGEIVLPAEVTREFGLVPGDALVVEREGSAFVVKSYLQIVKETQIAFSAMLPVDYCGSLADELIADRRAEAALEDEEAAEYSKRTP